MTDRNSALEDPVESLKTDASEIAGSQHAVDRRRLFRKLVALLGLGITSVVLTQPGTGLVQEVYPINYMEIDNAHNPGSGTTGLESSVSTGAAFAATATGTSGGVYGILGQSYSTGGTGVQGMARATTGAAIGVYGESDSSSDSAIGVDAWAKGLSGPTYGVYAQSDSTGGTGVDGFASAKTGTTWGVFGESDSTGGRGVEGGQPQPAGIR